MHPRGNKFLLFLISSNGVPKHWTTSVNKGDTKTCITEPISSDVTDATNCHCPVWYWQLFSSIQSSSSQISCPSFPLPEDPREIPVHKVSWRWSEQHSSFYKPQSSLAGRISRLAQIEPSKLLLSRSFKSTNGTIELLDLVLYLRVLWRQAQNHFWGSVLACHVWIPDLYFAGVYECCSMLQSWRRPQKFQVPQSSTSCSP